MGTTINLYQNFVQPLMILVLRLMLMYIELAKFIKNRRFM